MLKKLTIKNLTVFPTAKFNFAEGLNVFVGENGCGKSHFLKIAYSIIAASAEEGKKPHTDVPTKSNLQKLYADKLVHVMRPESLGRLARRKQGREKCVIEMQFDNKELNTAFSFATASKTEVQIQQLPEKWHSKSPIFFPTRELLTIFPGFVSIYESHYLEFEETYRDTCILLGAPALKGPRQSKIKKLLQPIEKAMGGTVILDRNGRFYLKIPKEGNVEMPLVAEGLRKLAMVARLIATGSLLDKGYLFWDEPETNLNPKLIKLIAEVILHLCKNGIQVFMATHSLFLMRELEILSQQKDFAQIGKRYFALSSTENGVVVEQDETVEGLNTLVMLDEELAQSDRFMSVGEE